MKCNIKNLSLLKTLVSQLVGYECGISRSFMFDGLFVSVLSNSSEFFYAVVYTEANSFASVVAQFSFFPTAKRLYLGYCIDKNCRTIVKEAFADSIPNVAINDTYDVLVKFAASHEMVKKMDESCPCYFTDYPVSRSYVPSGIYLYDVRYDDLEGFSPASIEQAVGVNLYGTIAVSVPLPVPISLSVPYVPCTEDGDIDSAHRVKGKPVELGSMLMGDRFYPDQVPECAVTGVETIVDAPIYPNMIIVSVDKDKVLATDEFGGIHSFKSDRRVWLIPEVLSLFS